MKIIVLYLMILGALSGRAMAHDSEIIHLLIPEKTLASGELPDDYKPGTVYTNSDKQAALKMIDHLTEKLYVQRKKRWFANPFISKN